MWMLRSLKKHYGWLILLALGCGLAGCSLPGLAEGASPASATLPADTPTPALPTPTLPPMAAWVNGEGILLSELEAEVRRFESAQAELGKSVAPEEGRRRVLDMLIEETLLAQGAARGGFTPGDEALQQRYDQLAEQAGAAAFAGWLSANHYSEESFRLALRRSIAAAWQRDQIIAGVGETADQVHAQQILLMERDLAQRVSQQATDSSKFIELAKRYDPLTGGDLGWFPRGYLTQPKVEEAAFALEAGEISGIIETSFGYHIIYVIERDPAHKLTAEAWLALQRAALRQWLQEQKAGSQIEVLVK